MCVIGDLVDDSVLRTNPTGTTVTRDPPWGGGGWGLGSPDKRGTNEKSHFLSPFSGYHYDLKPSFRVSYYYDFSFYFKTTVNIMYHFHISKIKDNFTFS